MEQRILSRRNRGSSNWNKQRIKVARIQASVKYVKESQAIQSN